MARIYEDEDMNTWKFDMIHIRKGSKYDGVVEKSNCCYYEPTYPGNQANHPSKLNSMCRTVCRFPA